MDFQQVFQRSETLISALVVARMGFLTSKAATWCSQSQPIQPMTDPQCRNFGVIMAIESLTNAN